ncbi:MAG TPA: hypothetical protein GXZ67_09800 [Clostridiaceae bacterium]|nr:hypothetical protein [Clostridiaceae bacterium]
MKKKILGIALVFAMLVPISACAKKATVDSLFKDSEKALGKVDSYEAEMYIELDASLVMDTVSVGLKADSEINAEVTEDGMYLSGNMNIEIPMQGNQSVDFEMYGLNEKDEITVYASDGSEWTKTVVEGEDYEGFSTLLDTTQPEAMMSLLSNYADEFDLDKKLEKVNKEDAYVLTGKVDGMILVDWIKDSELDASVDDIEEMLETLADEGIDLEDYEAEVSIWINKKSSLPAKIEIDFAGMLSALFEDAMATVGEEVMQGMEFEIDITTATVSVVFSEVNKVDAIKVPKKVEDAAVEMDEDDLMGIVDEFSIPL